MAYASHLNTLYHAIFIANVETGETRQVTDGLADAVSPAWDASGKYLWFFASTDFGLKSQWLDMTSYDHNENFGLYLMVLKKGEASPLLPESDEDKGVGAAPPHRAAEEGQTEAAAAAPRAPVSVQIDFDGLRGSHDQRAGGARAPVRAPRGRGGRHGVLPRGGTGGRRRTAARTACCTASG